MYAPALEHTAFRQVVVVGQFAQLPPLSPHLLRLVPAEQVDPERQPEQQAPPAHWPVLLLQTVPFALLVLVQLPETEQASEVQSLLSLQLTHWFPPEPHLDKL